ncbi:MAG: hypothetical protein L0Z48_00065 [candidate division Zixibacteria bacterium]|nr:hypothetical protein [candidate division Zixibacteria bacterium]
MFKDWLLFFVASLGVAIFPSSVCPAQDVSQSKENRELFKSAKAFIIEILSHKNSLTDGTFSDSILHGFQQSFRKDENDLNNSKDEEDFYSPEILGVAFTNTDNIRAFIEVHSEMADEITFTDFSHKVSAKEYFKEKEAVEKVTRQLLANFQKRPDYENYQLLSDSMIAGYKDIGIYDAKSYADSFKTVKMNKLSQILGTAFVHKDSARVFVEEFREDGIKYTTFINFVRQRNGWKFDGYDARYICPY